MQSDDLTLYDVYFFDSIRDKFYELLSTFGDHRVSSIEHSGNLNKVKVRLSGAEVTIIRLKFLKKDVIAMESAIIDLVYNHQGYAVDQGSL